MAALDRAIGSAALALHPPPLLQDAFFKKLPSLLPSIPTLVAQRKLLPMLASAIEFGGAPPVSTGAPAQCRRRWAAVAWRTCGAHAGIRHCVERRAARWLESHASGVASACCWVLAATRLAPQQTGSWPIACSMPTAALCTHAPQAALTTLLAIGKTLPEEEQTKQVLQGGHLRFCEHSLPGGSEGNRNSTSIGAGQRGLCTCMVLA